MWCPLLGLLLAGAEPSSYGFLARPSPPGPLDGDTRGHANNVVHQVNDFHNTMHNEVPHARMEQPGTHKHSLLELTNPLHAAQCEQVHPRGPANFRDVDLNTTGLDPPSNHHATDAICTADEHHADHSELHSATNHTMVIEHHADHSELQQIGSARGAKTFL